MFGLGMPEILMILAIALIVIGPKKLPDLAKTLGRAMGEFKRSAQDFKHSIDVETTVTDIKDAVDPKIDLEEILKEANTKDTVAGESQKDTDAENPGNEVPENNSADATTDKKVPDTDSKPEKTDNPPSDSDKS